MCSKALVYIHNSSTVLEFQYRYIMYRKLRCVRYYRYLGNSSNAVVVVIYKYRYYSYKKLVWDPFFFYIFKWLKIELVNKNFFYKFYGKKAIYKKYYFNKNYDNINNKWLFNFIKIKFLFELKKKAPQNIMKTNMKIFYL